jgi:hypothetical protein
VVIEDITILRRRREDLALGNPYTGDTVQGFIYENHLAQ